MQVQTLHVNVAHMHTPMFVQGISSVPLQSSEEA